MSLNNYIKAFSLGLICTLGLVPMAQAQWPTLDISAIVQGAKGIAQQVEQYKTQIMESKTVSSINTAIGDAKSSMSKFSLDELEAKKKKAEKALKEAEKLKKIQEDIQKAKKAYEEKKKSYDDYKQKLANAKSNVASKVNDAKSAVNDAKAKVNDAKSKVNDAKSKVNDAKSTINDVKSKVNNATSKAVAKVNDVKSTVNDVKSKANNATSKAVAKVNDVKSTINEAKSIAMPATSPVSTGTSGRKAFSTTTTPSVATTTPKEVTKPAQIETPSLTVEQVKEVSATEGVPSGVQALGKTLNEAVDKKDTKTLDAIAKIDPADVVTSDSKIYDNGQQPVIARKAFTTTETVKDTSTPEASSVNEQPKVEEATAKVLLDEQPKITASPVAETGLQKPTLVRRELQKLDLAPVDTTTPSVSTGTTSSSAVRSGGGGGGGRVMDILEEASPTDDLAPNRKKFQTQQMMIQGANDIWINNGDRSRHLGTKLSYNETLKFGSAECKYNNAIMSGDDGEVVILSETLAKECCIDAKDLTDLNIIRDCAKKLVEKMNDKDSTVAAEAYSVFMQIAAEQLKYGLAESLDNTKDSSQYLSKVLKKYKEDMQQASTTKDNISIISMTNTELLFLLNRIRKIYTSSLVTAGINSLDSINEKVTNPATDIGVGDVNGDYNPSVSRGDIEYPVIPENLAKKCLINVQENIEKVRDCYIDVVRDMHKKNATEADTGLNFAKNIRYQSILDALTKSLYQKVKSAKYDEQLQKAKDKNNDATTIRTTADGLFNTDYEIQEILDDIVNMLASRIAYSSVDIITTLNKPSTDDEDSGKTEG